MHIAVVEKQEGSDDTHNSLRLCGFVQCLYRGILYTYPSITNTILTLSASSSSLSLSNTHICTYAHMHTLTRKKEEEEVNFTITFIGSLTHTTTLWTMHACMYVCMHAEEERRGTKKKERKKERKKEEDVVYTERLCSINVVVAEQ
jgi:hypothetical protein